MPQVVPGNSNHCLVFGIDHWTVKQETVSVTSEVLGKSVPNTTELLLI